MPSILLRDGDAVMFVDERGRKHLKQLRAGHRITIRATVFRTDDLIGRPDGTVTRGDGGESGERFAVLKPSYADLVTEIERPAEPVFTKDAAMIVVRGNIGSGDRIIETGVGSGALTLALLRAVGPSGSVSSYEIREDFVEVSRETVARYHGDAPNWTPRLGDAADGFEERDVDHVVVDLPEPVAAIGPAFAALRPGGGLAVYLPNVSQVKALHDALVGHGGFCLVETLEVLERGWELGGRSTRPKHRMVAHTAFLTFARRLDTSG